MFIAQALAAETAPSTPQSEMLNYALLAVGAVVVLWIIYKLYRWSISRRTIVGR